MAKVSLDGVVKIVSTALVEDLQVGDYVVLHVGYALAKIDPEEAERTLELLGFGGRAAAMKYVDEYRDGKLAKGIAATIAREADPDAPLSLHGVLRRPHPCDFALRPRGPAARERAHDPRAGLPGLRSADGAHRHGDSPARAIQK